MDERERKIRHRLRTGSRAGRGVRKKNTKEKKKEAKKLGKEEKRSKQRTYIKDKYLGFALFIVFAKNSNQDPLFIASYSL